MQHARRFSVVLTRCGRVPPIGSLSFGGLIGLVARQVLLAGAMWRPDGASSRHCLSWGESAMPRILRREA
jgi:hypothetical protein